MEQQPRHAWEWTKSNKNKQTNKQKNKQKNSHHFQIDHSFYYSI